MIVRPHHEVSLLKLCFIGYLRCSSHLSLEDLELSIDGKILNDCDTLQDAGVYDRCTINAKLSLEAIKAIVNKN